MFIDAPTTRSWLIHSKIVQHAKDFANIPEGPILPLTHCGQLNEIKHGNRICDFWMGPTGALIYHFHEPYPDLDDIPAMVGLPPQLKKKQIDTGFAFITVANCNNPVWYPTIFWSFIKAFEGSTLYLVNGKKPDGNIFSEIPAELIPLQKQLFGMIGKEHKSTIKIGVFADHRFLAKVALGIGAKFLGDSFLTSPMAIQLRKFMWGKTLEQRKEQHIHGTSLFTPKNKEELIEFFGWEGGHLLTLMNLPDGVALNLTLYNTYSAQLKIEKYGDDYRDKIGDGICFAIAPGQKKIIGPMKFIHFLNHKLDMGRIIPELAEVEQEMQKYKEKPPFNL